MSKPIIKKLENGLRVVYVPFPGIDSLSVRLMGRAGSLWETPEELGVAHYIEHLLFDGTVKFPNPDDLRGLIENGGGYINGYTSNSEVCYIVKTVPTEIENSFLYLSQLSMHSLLREEDIEKQRTVIIQEYNNSLDNPVTNFWLNTQKHVFAEGSRLQQPNIGIHKTLESMSKDQLKNYYKSNYTADNFVLSICGDGIEKQAFEMAEKYFNPMVNGKLNEYTTKHYIDEPTIYTEKNEKVQQATIHIVYQAPNDYEDRYYPTTYVDRILGTGLMSRLFREIRQKRGLAYRASTGYYVSPYYGYLAHIAQVEPKNIDKVLKLIKIEVEKLAKDGITDEEYNRAKKALKSRHIFNNESPEKRAGTQGGLVLEGHEDETYESLLKKLMAVTKEDVNNIAKKIYSHHPKVCVLSNKITDEQISNAWNS